MGGSALRGMAFGKPLVVQGERGFWELLTPESAPTFLRQGWYGVGGDVDGRAAGAARLSGILRGLLDDTGARVRLGEYGRALVVERFSLDRAGAVQEQVYAEAVEAPIRPSAMQLTADAVRTGMGVLRHKGGGNGADGAGSPLPVTISTRWQGTGHQEVRRDSRSTRNHRRSSDGLSPEAVKPGRGNDHVRTYPVHVFGALRRNLTRYGVDEMVPVRSSRHPVLRPALSCSVQTEHGRRPYLHF